MCEDQERWAAIGGPAPSVTGGIVTGFRTGTRLRNVLRADGLWSGNRAHEPRSVMCCRKHCKIEQLRHARFDLETHGQLPHYELLGTTGGKAYGRSNQRNEVLTVSRGCPGNLRLSKIA
jgi:hypothetical protein